MRSAYLCSEDIMQVTIFTKNGDPTASVNHVVKVKTMYIEGVGSYDTLLDLQLELENGEELEYYLSDFDRFAIIEQGNR